MSASKTEKSRGSLLAVLGVAVAVVRLGACLPLLLDFLWKGGVVAKARRGLGGWGERRTERVWHVEQVHGEILWRVN
jgi:hypothetical protein